MFFLSRTEVLIEVILLYVGVLLVLSPPPWVDLDLPHAPPLVGKDSTPPPPTPLLSADILLRPEYLKPNSGPQFVDKFLCCLFGSWGEQASLA